MISSKTRLCIKVLVAMASVPPNRPVNVQTLSQRLHVSISHMESIMRVLREAGFVTAARGPGGGYCLACEPDGLSVWAVLQAIEPTQVEPPASGPQPSPIAELEAGIHATFSQFLASRTIGEFAQLDEWTPPTPGTSTSGFRLRPLPKRSMPQAPNSVFQLSAFGQLRAA